MRRMIRLRERRAGSRRGMHWRQPATCANPNAPYRWRYHAITNVITIAEKLADEFRMRAADYDRTGSLTELAERISG